MYDYLEEILEGSCERGNEPLGFIKGEKFLA
jgi:hypothetical protein